MVIGFTGTQHGMTQRQKDSLLYIFNWMMQLSHSDLRLRHGDCIGADADAHDIFQSLPLSQVSDVKIHPCILANKRAYKDGLVQHEPLSPLMRNRYIAGCNPTFRTDLLIAAPGEDTEQLRSGTWATIRYARKCGTPRIILLP